MMVSGGHAAGRPLCNCRVTRFSVRFEIVADPNVSRLLCSHPPSSMAGQEQVSIKQFH